MVTCDGVWREWAVTWKRWVAGAVLVLVLANVLEAADPIGNTNVPAPSSAVATNEAAVTNAAPSAAQEPSAHEPATNTPPAPATPPELRAISTPVAAEKTNALSSFHLKPGFQIELVASEPLVVAPAAMAFDENGRLFVAEMRDYPDRRNSTPHLGRVRVLEQTEDEGLFTSSAIYADDLALPSAIACSQGGVFVAVTPDILYLKDTKQTGTADYRRVAFGGFGATNQITADMLINSFAWGPDNRIHGLTAGLSGSITAASSPSASPVPLDNCDFSFDPRLITLFLETGPAQSGLAFDSWGRKFLTDHVRPLRRPMYELRYIARNPFFAAAPDLLDVEEPAVPLFMPHRRPPTNTSPPASGGSPRVTRSGQSQPGVSAWLAQARGTCIYRGTAFPTNYQDNVFIADPVAHGIHRAILRTAGLLVVAGRAPDDRVSEFLTSDDPAFRPSQIVNGPDGALYVADLRDGGERGRIYRIAPANWVRPEQVRLGDATIAELVTALASPNGWQSDTAARLLAERRDPAATPLLANLLNNSRFPFVRLRALRALDGMDALTDAHVLRGTGDQDARIRQAAVLLAERFFSNGATSEALFNRLRSLAADISIDVRMQVAYTLGGLATPDRLGALAEILRRDPANPWIQTAVLSAVPNDGGALFAGVVRDANLRSDPGGAAFLRQLASLVGTSGHRDEVLRTIEAIDTAPLNLPAAFPLISSLGEGLQRTRSALALIDSQGRLRPFADRALNIGLDPTAAEALRIEAICVVGSGIHTYAEAGDWLYLLFGAGQSFPVQSAALAALGRFPDPHIATNIVARWPVFPPVLRSQALNALFLRSEHIPTVMAFVDSGAIPPADLSGAQINFLRTCRDAAVSAAAVRRFGPFNPQRSEMVKRYSEALRITGSAIRGRQLFLARCSGCHQLGGFGNEVGPDLGFAKAFGKERILKAILEPSTLIEAGYVTYVLESQGGDNLIGIADVSDPQAVSIRQPGGFRVVWPRSNVQLLAPQPWSLMPDGLERGWAPRDMADLLEFILTSN